MRLFLFTPPTTLPNEHAALHALASRAKSSSSSSSGSSSSSSSSGGAFALPAALHVRKPGTDEASVEDYLKRLPEALLQRAVLHSHHALASKFDIQGIHFTEAARNALPGGRPQRPSESSKGKGGGALFPGGRRLLTLSTSLHSCAEVEAEAEAKARRREESPDDPSCYSFDYVFLSPLFESISKPGYGGGGDGKAGGSGVSAQFWRSGGEGEEEGSSSPPSPSPALAAALRSARESPRRRLGVVALGGVEASRLRLVAGLGFEAAAVLGAVWGREDPVEAWAEVLKEAAAAAASASASASASSSAAAAAPS